MDKVIGEFISKIKDIHTVKEYETIMAELNHLLLTEDYSEKLRTEILVKQKYIKNRFSDEANREKMQEAKENVLEVLQRYLKNEKTEQSNSNLIHCLENFYLFLDALTERTIDKRATVKLDDLQKIKIGNEYDLQHILYAILKPWYPDLRKEVSQDSGVGTVRADLNIPSLDINIEVKCTREGMSLKKLTEEIEADIVHYRKCNLIFFVYDKAKIIKEKQNYKAHFNGVFGEKKIEMIVLQPIVL